MTDSTDTIVGTSDAAADDSTKPRRRAGLSGMMLAELRELATSVGISNTQGMRKNDLIAAIKDCQNGSAAAPSSRTEPAQATGPDTASAERPRRAARRPAASPDAVQGVLIEPDRNGSAPAPIGDQPAADRHSADAGGRPLSGSDNATGRKDARDARQRDGQTQAGGRDLRDNRGNGRTESSQRAEYPRGADTSRNDNQRVDGGRGEGSRNDGARTDYGRGDNSRGDGARTDNSRGENSRGENGRDDDYENRNRRGRRFRDRKRSRGDRGPETSEPVVSDDDVLIPVAGILDVLDNYAFIRTSGYLTGPNDVYVSLSQVRKNNLRRGDAVTGAVRQPREGERRDKYNALVRLDTVNDRQPEQMRDRPEFHKMIPLYPQERLRLETESNKLSTRVIDLVMPIGKGQRALIQSPPKAGKTTVLQQIANGISTNNPECHLMVVLVDERPEEVTDMQRTIKGEVIASTFDRPPSDHTTVAELSIERAKRMVELGYDVVVMLDSITRLGRAYNLAAPASGRILSGGVDSTALYPPKRFLGAARNIEGGGSLTIIATALVETGSTADTVIFEEFKATGNAELKLDRKLADKRIFPAVDVDSSSTRKEEILLGPDELAIVIKLRRVLAALDTQSAIELVLDRLRKTRNNIEFLMQVQKTAPGRADD